MNTYAKYCPNVFVAKCTERHEKGDVITVTTKYGKENEHYVHNLVAERAMIGDGRVKTTFEKRCANYERRMAIIEKGFVSVASTVKDFLVY